MSDHRRTKIVATLGPAWEEPARMAALIDAGVTAFRVSVSGAPRAPICGMGSCFECRVTVDGRPHQRSCLIPCRDGMIVETGSGRAS